MMNNTRGLSDSQLHSLKDLTSVLQDFNRSAERLTRQIEVCERYKLTVHLSSEKNVEDDEEYGFKQKLAFIELRLTVTGEMIKEAENANKQQS